MSVIIRKCIFTLTNRLNSFPALFFSSSSNFSDPILSCLNQTGFSAPQIDQMINKHPQILKISPEILKSKLKIIHDYGFSDPDIIDIVSINPNILLKTSVPTERQLRFMKDSNISDPKISIKKTNKNKSHPKNSHKTTDSILGCLDRIGFSGEQIDQMIDKSPRILNARPEMLKAKLKIFRDNGFSTSDTVDIVSKHPMILLQSSENRIETSIAALKSVLGSTEAVIGVLKKLSWFPKSDLEKTMVPNVNYLRERFNLSSFKVAEIMVMHSMIFLLGPEALAEGARRIDEMGLEWTPKMYLHAISVLCSLSPATLELKKGVFFGFGYSESEVLRIFNRCPRVFTCSEKNLKETMEVLLSSGRTDRSSLALKTTELILLSLEKRIKPRLEVVEALEQRGLLLKKLSLSSILHMTNKEFMEKLVLSNSDALGKDFVISITNRMGGNS